MQVIVEHNGDQKTSPEQSQEYALERNEGLIEPHGLRDDVAMSVIEDVDRAYRDKFEQLRVEVGDDEVVLPNVEVVEVRRKT